MEVLTLILLACYYFLVDTKKDNLEAPWLYLAGIMEAERALHTLAVHIRMVNFETVSKTEIS